MPPPGESTYVLDGAGRFMVCGKSKKVTNRADYDARPLNRTPIEWAAKVIHSERMRVGAEAGSGRGAGNPAPLRVVSETDGMR
ncbi:hypothetical protein GCM10008959_09760 [Deinococcus seoulensis]|uniref:Uncharacterized protein n=1 Tax=Deinococcus seoulensis TaxID=1837379 RepID=A0ABQ2RNQ2_9DEIO|nr:hypothetical protein GCM10008959_09760 [Deinococcus seoulensis]